MEASLQSVSTYLNALSLRERVLVTLVLGAVIYAIFNAALLSGFERQYQQQLTEQHQIQQQQQQLDLTMTIAAKELSDSNKARLQTTQAIEQKKQNLQQVQLDLDTVFNKFIAPTKITELLRSLLITEDSPTIISLHNDPVNTISFDDNTATSKINIQTLLYQHAATIKLAGSYQQLYQYLVTLEQSEWELFWDQLHYKVLEYPNAEISLQVHTISADKHWIGL